VSTVRTARLATVERGAGLGPEGLDAVPQQHEPDVVRYARQYALDVAVAVGP